MVFRDEKSESRRTAGEKSVILCLPSYRLLNAVCTLLKTFVCNGITRVHFLEVPLAASHVKEGLFTSALHPTSYRKKGIFFRDGHNRIQRAL